MADRYLYTYTYVRLNVIDSRPFRGEKINTDAMAKFAFSFFQYATPGVVSAARELARSREGRKLNRGGNVSAFS